MCRLVHIALVAGLLLGGASTWAGEGSRPLLEQLNAESQSLYQEVQGGIVRVQLPPPRWMREAAAAENPIHKWDGLDPAVQRKLKTVEDRLERGGTVDLRVAVAPSTHPAQDSAGRARPATRPATQAGGWIVTTGPGGVVRLESRQGVDGGSNGTILELRSGGEIDPTGARAPATGPVHLAPRAARAGEDFAPNNVGLLLDNAGHVLVPMYLDAPSIPAGGVRLSIGGAAPAMARFIGSDRQTNLSLFQVENAPGRPIHLSDARPTEGSVVKILSPNNGAGRLALWTGGQQDYGVVVAMDGSIFGFARYGQFLSASACKPVLRQLIETGTVKRARLGIVVREVLRDDPDRVALPELGSRPALRIAEVAEGSVAQAAGLRADDLLLSINGQPVGDPPTFGALLAACRGRTALLILRDGTSRTIEVDLKAE
jgi:hypothetical protein